MKKTFLLIFAILSVSMTAQKKEKIKGNREVLIKKFDVPTFNTLEVGERFNIKLEKAIDTTRVIIETDDNLFDVIHYQVEDGVLKFYTSMEIVKKKRLRITVFVPEDFHQIKLREKAKVFNEDKLAFNTLQIETTDKSSAELNLQVKDAFTVNMQGKSEIEMEVFGPKASFNLSEGSELTAKLNIKDLDLNAEGHASAKLEGNVEQLVLKAGDKAQIKASELDVKEADISNRNKAVIYINISGKVVLSLSGKSETYLYGSPKIKLKSFNDNAVLYKK